MCGGTTLGSYNSAHLFSSRKMFSLTFFLNLFLLQCIQPQVKMDMCKENYPSNPLPLTTLVTSIFFSPYEAIKHTEARCLKSAVDSETWVWIHTIQFTTWPWTKYITSVRLSFPLCKMGLYINFMKLVNGLSEQIKKPDKKRQTLHNYTLAQLVRNLPATWETWVQSLGWENPLEKGKATHCSVLAQRIPWTV